MKKWETSDRKVMCPLCKEVFNMNKMITKRALIENILKMIGSKNQKYDLNLSWAQTKDIHDWIERKNKKGGGEKDGTNV